jgi:hypothetical protein
MIMEMLRLEIGEIASLGTQVAMHGAIRAGDFVADEVFELVVAIATVVYEIWPG